MKNEECSWKAVDDLEAKVELEAANAEVGRLRVALDTAEASLRVVSEVPNSDEKEFGSPLSCGATRSQGVRPRQLRARVKDSLKLARAENTSHLNDVVADEDVVVQSLHQEYDCVKDSEATAQGSLKELNNLLAPTTTTAQKK
jgi:hypothetical protein